MCSENIKKLDATFISSLSIALKGTEGNEYILLQHPLGSKRALHNFQKLKKEVGDKLAPFLQGNTK